MQDILKSEKNLAIWYMLTTSKKHNPQLGMFLGLSDQLNQKHPLYHLAHKIQWSVFEEAFNPDYAVEIFLDKSTGYSHSPTNHFLRFLVSAIFSFKVSPIFSK